MSRTPKCKRSSAYLLMLFVLGLASSSHAVDGVVEINHVRALAGGVTASDTAGYPVTIDVGGSYRLTSDLVAPDENTTAVLIGSGAADVALDLNGFSIRGPQLSGSGLGISASSSSGRLQIFNGGIAGMGSSGIFISGRLAEVDSVVLRNNGGYGMQCISATCFLRRSLLQQNAFDGINCSFGTCHVTDNHFLSMGSRGIFITYGIVSRNTVLASGSDGIRVNAAVVTENNVYTSGGVGIYVLQESVVAKNLVTGGSGDGIEVFSSSVSVRENLVSGNSGFGLRLNNTTGYSQNVMDSNTSGAVISGVQMGTNVCNGNTTCP